MAKTKPCAETFDTADGRTLTCSLPAGHDGPVHEDNGEVWGDQRLTPPEPSPQP